MTIEGTVKDGVVVLEGSTRLPDGTRVRVEPIRVETIENAEPRTIYERYASIIGKAKGLPPDAAQNHDQYLYDEKCQ